MEFPRNYFNADEPVMGLACEQVPEASHRGQERPGVQLRPRVGHPALQD